MIINLKPHYGTQMGSIVDTKGDAVSAFVNRSMYSLNWTAIHILFRPLRSANQLLFPCHFPTPITSPSMYEWLSYNNVRPSNSELIKIMTYLIRVIPLIILILIMQHKTLLPIKCPKLLENIKLELTGFRYLMRSSFPRFKRSTSNDSTSCRSTTKHILHLASLHPATLILLTRVAQPWFYHPLLHLFLF